MHTLNAPKGTRFHYNSDLSGNVIVMTPEGEFHVPGDDLLAFVADYVREERIARLEQASAAELLGLRESGAVPIIRDGEVIGHVKRGD